VVGKQVLYDLFLQESLLDVEVIVLITRVCAQETRLLSLFIRAAATAIAFSICLLVLYGRDRLVVKWRCIVYHISCVRAGERLTPRRYRVYHIYRDGWAPFYLILAQLTLYCLINLCVVLGEGVKDPKEGNLLTYDSD